MQCPKCHRYVPDEAKFCPTCGHLMAPQQQDYTQEQNYTPQQGYVPPQQYDKAQSQPYQQPGQQYQPQGQQYRQPGQPYTPQGQQPYQPTQAPNQYQQTQAPNQYQPTQAQQQYRQQPQHTSHGAPHGSAPKKSGGNMPNRSIIMLAILVGAILIATILLILMLKKLNETEPLPNSETESTESVSSESTVPTSPPVTLIPTSTPMPPTATPSITLIPTAPPASPIATPTPIQTPTPAPTFTPTPLPSPTATPSPTPSGSLSGDYVLPGSDTRLISESELTGLTDWEIRVARNEIYARHGLMFKTQALQDHFNSKSWYHGTIAAGTDIGYLLNDTEKKNISTITSYEKAHNINQ